MDVSNSFIASGLQNSLLNPVSPAERQDRLPAKQSGNQEPNTQSRNEQVRVVDRVDYIKKGESLQNDRAQRYQAIENAPFKNQQALLSYQQTEEAARQFETGSLVGIDLFV